MFTLRVAVGLSAAMLTACSAAPTPPIPPAAPPVSAPAAAAPGTGFPAQPLDVPFPTKVWTRGEWPAGVGRGGLDRTVDEAFAGGAAVRVRAVVIVHRGRLVYERYSPNPADGADVSMPSFSVAKSLTSAAAGTLVRQGKLDVRAPVAAPEWAAATDPRHAITADNLLRLTSGLQWNEGIDLDESGRTRDEAHYAADKPLVAAPGSTFNYNTDSPCILARAMATALGGPGQFTRFVETELFDKLGMAITLTYDDKGTWLGGFAASAPTVDYAKLGLLYLRDGVWAGERVLPPGWVDYSRMPTPANHDYGAGWWLDGKHPGVFSALGAHGQVLTVDPAHDLTFVITTANGDSAAVSTAILDAFAG